jgi:hypothetical protein
MKLFKRQDRYDLYADTDHKVASSAPNPFGKLSKQNCDEIFGIVDVEKLANEMYKDNLHNPFFSAAPMGFIDGFNKAMELNKDKLFTLEDMRNTMDWIMTQYFEFYECPTTGRREQYLESLQQPTEIDVEIEVEPKENKDLVPLWTYENKLDSNGNLILRKL